jgi:hypothetical protein
VLGLDAQATPRPIDRAALVAVGRRHFVLAYTKSGELDLIEYDQTVEVFGDAPAWSGRALAQATSVSAATVGDHSYVTLYSAGERLLQVLEVLEVQPELPE